MQILRGRVLQSGEKSGTTLYRYEARAEMYLRLIAIIPQEEHIS